MVSVGVKKYHGAILVVDVVLSYVFVGVKTVFGQPVRFSHFLSRLWKAGHVLRPSGWEHYLLPFRPSTRRSMRIGIESEVFSRAVN
jgi:hypothetical protein